MRPLPSPVRPDRDITTWTNTDMHDKPGLIGCSNRPVSGFSTLSIVGFITLCYVNGDGKGNGDGFIPFSDVLRIQWCLQKMLQTCLFKT